MNYFRRIVIFLSFIFIAACYQNESATLKNPFESTAKKVLLYKDKKPQGINRLFQSDLLSNSAVLPLGTSLAVLINEKCLTNHITQSVFGFRETATQEPLKKRSSEQTHKVTLTKSISIKELNRIAKEDRCIVGISHNRPAFTSSTYNDPMTTEQHHLRDIKSESTYHFFKSQNAEATRDEIVMAVIDTGLDTSHPDLSDSIWSNNLELNGLPGVDDDDNGYVDDIHGYNFSSNRGSVAHETFNDHGTHVAGLAAARANNGVGVTGVMGHGLKIMALNVFGKYTGTETTDIDEAIRYAADNGARIINISVGGPGESETTAAAITYALSKGAVVIASSGNLKMNIEQNVYYPASYSQRYKGMIAVGASVSGAVGVCEFSNFSDKAVKVFAPGCDLSAPKFGLLSTKANGKYGHMKGTSMATPIVSASMALTLAFAQQQLKEFPSPEVAEDLFLNGCERAEYLNGYSKENCLLNLEYLQKSISKEL